MAASAVLQVDGLAFGYPQRGLFEGWSTRIPPGVTLLRGGDGVGKTTLLRLLAGDLPAQAGRLRVNGVDLADQPVPYRQQVLRTEPRSDAWDPLTPAECFNTVRQRHPQFNTELLSDLIDGLSLAPHMDKRLFMLSTGSKRKVALAAAFAAGAAVTLLDQPFAALDKSSIEFLMALLQEAADHPSRAWVVADYQAPEGLRLAGAIDLGD